MTDLEKEFGIERVIDTPVSESACTGAAIGAGLAGMRSVIVHPRMDFMLYAMDAIVNEAAKWSSMTGGQASPAVTIRSIINRGGEQGAQHSQSLQAWFAHTPGLRVVAPATPTDARDLLIASVLSPHPVLYIDDRWLYDDFEEMAPPQELDLAKEGAVVRRLGSDVTLVGSSFSMRLIEDSVVELEKKGISCEVIDLRILNPMDSKTVVSSVRKTGRLVAVDGGWGPCGIAGEVIAFTCEAIAPRDLKHRPTRITLPFAPAPCSGPLEDLYYPSTENICKAVVDAMSGKDQT